MTGERDRDREAAYWRAFGEWMTARRAKMLPERWTQAKLATELGLIGTKVKREWIVQVEGGKKPSAELADAIQRLLGPAPEFDTSAPVSVSQLVEAIGALVDEMRLSRVQQEEQTRVLLEAVAALVGRPAPTGTSSGSEIAAPAGTGR